MGYFIAFIVVSMVLAPILWIMPSPQQKRQMALRQKAMQMGMQVKICDLPQTHRQQVRAQSPVKGVVYSIAYTAGDDSNERFEHICMRNIDDSDAVDSTVKDTKLGSLLADALKNLPEDVVALGYSDSGLAAYWTEKGGQEQVDMIHHQLKLLKNAIQTNNG